MCTPSFLFFFSKAAQHGLRPHSLHVPGGGVYLVCDVTEPGSVTCCSQLRAVFVGINCQNFKKLSSAVTLQILFMLKQEHYTLTNVKKVKAQSTTATFNKFISSVQPVTCKQSTLDNNDRVIVEISAVIW